MGLAVEVQHRGGRIVAEAAGAGLVRYRPNTHGVLDINLALHQMLLEIELVQQPGEPAVEPLGRGWVVRRVVQMNLALAIYGHPVVGVRQIF